MDNRQHSNCDTKYENILEKLEEIDIRKELRSKRIMKIRTNTDMETKDNTTKKKKRNYRTKKRYQP